MFQGFLNSGLRILHWFCTIQNGRFNMANKNCLWSDFFQNWCVGILKIVDWYSFIDFRKFIVFIERLK